jgi:hypothetical protein
MLQRHCRTGLFPASARIASWLLLFACGLLTAVEPPTVVAPVTTADATPTWTWSGAEGGDGVFRWYLDGLLMGEGTATAFTPSRPLLPIDVIASGSWWTPGGGGTFMAALQDDGSVRVWDETGEDYPVPDEVWSLKTLAGKISKLWPVVGVDVAG